MRSVLYLSRRGLPPNSEISWIKNKPWINILHFDVQEQLISLYFLKQKCSHKVQQLFNFFPPFCLFFFVFEPSGFFFLPFVSSAFAMQAAITRSASSSFFLLRWAGAWEEHGEGMTLTFKAFLAASASDRLSKLTNPTGWGDKETEQKKRAKKNNKTWLKAENWVCISVWVTKTRCSFFIYLYIYISFLIILNSLLLSCPVYKNCGSRGWGERRRGSGREKCRLNS